MIKGKFLYLGIIILLAFSLILTGCDNSLLDIGGSGSGELGGQITYDGGVEGVQVVILNETPETVSSYDDLSIVEETIVNNADGTYLFDGLSSGTYYVAAYKDENKSGKLEFNDSGIPVEPANIYSEGEEPAPVEVNDDTVTGIDITLSTELVETYTVHVKVITPQPTEQPLENAIVDLYSKAGAQVATGSTDVNGEYSFVDIFDGEYFLEITEDNNMGAILPYYLLREEDESDNAIDKEVSFSVPMFTETFISTAYGADAVGELLLGRFDNTEVGEEIVTLDPLIDVGNIAYEYEEVEGEMIFDFTSSQFPLNPPSAEPGYLLGIKNISSSVGDYSLSFTIGTEEVVINFPVKSNRLITLLNQSNIDLSGGDV